MGRSSSSSQPAHSVIVAVPTFTLVTQHPLRPNRRGWWGPSLRGLIGLLDPRVGERCRAFSFSCGPLNLAGLPRESGPIFLFSNYQPTKWAGDFFEEFECWRSKKTSSVGSELKATRGCTKWRRGKAWGWCQTRLVFLTLRAIGSCL